MLNLAAWHGAARLGVTARYYGNWATRAVRRVAELERNTPAVTVAEFLRGAGWDQADLIKCDIEGPEQAVFADPAQCRLQTLAIESHDGKAAGAAEIVAACLHPGLLEHARHGELALYQRRRSLRAAACPPGS